MKHFKKIISGLLTAVLLVTSISLNIFAGEPTIAEEQTIVEERTAVEESAITEESTVVEESAVSEEASVAEDLSVGVKYQNAVFLGFTSDVHNKSGDQSSTRLTTWLNNAAKITGTWLENLVICGDLGPGSGSNQTDYWNNARKTINAVQSNENLKNKGFFICGNHEYSPGGYSHNLNDLTALFYDSGSYVIEDNYIIYSLGAMQSTEIYSDEEINKLDSFLNKHKYFTGPVFVVAHFPIHAYSSSSSKETSTNHDGNPAIGSAKLIKVLNKYHNIFFIWGHNHSSSSAYYDTVYTDKINNTEINFVYAAAGCMSDSEYTNSANVKGKGLIAAITQNQVVLTYYDAAKNVVGTPAVIPLTQTPEGATYVGFSSDVHNNDSSNTNAGRLNTWINAVTDKIGTTLDNMAFSGDMGPQSGSNYWTYAQAAINVVANSSRVDNDGFYICGNHEYYPGEYSHELNSTTRLYSDSGTYAIFDDYILYSISAVKRAEIYPDEDIEELDAFLTEHRDCGKPIFILGHFPLHCYDDTVSGESAVEHNGMAAAGTAKLISVLNKYNNIFFLWGHNHSAESAYYSRVYTEQINDTDINFTYASAGCLINNTSGNAIVGKGLLATITDEYVDLNYYDLNGNIVGTGARVMMRDGETPVITHTITATAGPNGNISPFDEVEVIDSRSKTFTFKPDTGYELDIVRVNGQAVTVTNNSFTITNVTEDISIEATFRATFSGNTVSLTPSTSKPSASATVTVGGKVTVTIKNGSSRSSATYSCTVSDIKVASVDKTSATISKSGTGTFTLTGLAKGTTTVTFSSKSGSSTKSAVVNLTVNQSKSNYTLHITGSGFTVTGSDTVIEDEYNGKYTEGRSIVVDYEDVDRVFAYWTDSSDRVVSFNEKYKFTIASDINLHAVSFAGNALSGKSPVVFLSDCGQIMSIGLYGKNEPISYPVEPGRFGKAFDGWILEDGSSATDEAIWNMMDSGSVIKVYPKYKTPGKYSVTIKYEGVSQNAAVINNNISGDVCKVTADIYIVDKSTTPNKYYYFQYWKDENGKIFSYNTECNICSDRDITLTAVYQSKSIQRQAYVSVRGIYSDTLGEKYQTTFMEHYGIPANCTLIGTGFVETSDQSLATESGLVIGGKGIREFRSVDSDRSGNYILNLLTSDPSVGIYVRAYVKYYDNNGDIKILYSDIAHNNE